MRPERDLRRPFITVIIVVHNVTIVFRPLRGAAVERAVINFGAQLMGREKKHIKKSDLLSSLRFCYFGGDRGMVGGGVKDDTTLSNDNDIVFNLPPPYFKKTHRLSRIDTDVFGDLRRRPKDVF